MNRIEQEVNKTLHCLEQHTDIDVSEAFTQALWDRLDGMQAHRSGVYGRKIAYAAVITVLLVINFTTLWAGLKTHQTIDSTVVSQTPSSILASEYGIASQGELTF